MCVYVCTCVRIARELGNTRACQVAQCKPRSRPGFGQESTDYHGITLGIAGWD